MDTFVEKEYFRGKRKARYRRRRRHSPYFIDDQRLQRTQRHRQKLTQREMDKYYSEYSAPNWWWYNKMPHYYKTDDFGNQQSAYQMLRYPTPGCLPIEYFDKEGNRQRGYNCRQSYDRNAYYKHTPPFYGFWT